MNLASGTPPDVLADGSGQMFDGIAGRYDRMNRLLSLGLDRGWRKRMVRALSIQPDELVLDVATGTADVALLCAKKGARVHGIDPSPNMLEYGTTKVERMGFESRIELQVGEAEHLPFPVARFDAISIAFGIRNVRSRSLALAEAKRVLKPGGRLAILEFVPMGSRGLGPLVSGYSKYAVRTLGSMFSSGPAYAYLNESIEAFPNAADFSEELVQAGFSKVRIRRMGFGVCALFLTSRPSALSVEGG